MKLLQLASIALSLISYTAGQSFCSKSGHSGQSTTVYNSKVGSIGGVGYEMWSSGGNNNSKFYSDGSFSCNFNGSRDFLCRSGLSLNSSKKHAQVGHLYADFKVNKKSVSNVDYSYVGVYGWTRYPLVEFYIVDNWLGPYRPGDWVGNRKYGDFKINGATYTVYSNTRTGDSIDGYTTFKQYFSIRKSGRSCGTIDVTAHFKQWEKLGMNLGNLHEVKILAEAGSNGYGTSGSVDFPYARVYTKNKSKRSELSDIHNDW